MLHITPTKAELITIEDPLLLKNGIGTIIFIGNKFKFVRTGTKNSIVNR